MTDNEIIKALECCSKKICKQCPNFSEDIECSEKLINLTLDYIARQLHELQERYEEAQAEIERLKGSVIINNIMEIQKIKREAKSEAIKEFAERLKEKSEIVHLFSVHTGDRYMVDIDDIDNLVKEMVGDDNA